VKEIVPDHENPRQTSPSTDLRMNFCLLAGCRIILCFSAQPSPVLRAFNPSGSHGHPKDVAGKTDRSVTGAKKDETVEKPEKPESWFAKPTPTKLVRE
jgi:hypothetical protein